MSSQATKSSISLYFRYWGKAEKDGPNYHLLPYHCLDVAAVGAVWWDASSAIRRGFRQASELPEHQFRAWVLFFVALHDYGKLDIRFQLKARSIWQALYPDSSQFQNNLPSVFECKNYIHGEGGLYWFNQDQTGNDSSGIFDFDNILALAAVTKQKVTWQSWLEAVAGHHGHIKDTDFVANLSLPVTCDKRIAAIDNSARKEWLQALEQLFLAPAGLSLSDNPPPCPRIFLAGFCSVADWLGSNSDEGNFLYCQEQRDLKAYFDERYCHDAERLVNLAGVVGKPKQYDGVKTIIPPGQAPHVVQILVDDLPLLSGLAIIEAPTGSGKTEAALAYAWRLVAAGLADSIVFALPTQATANAMLGRLQRIAPVLFDDHPNLLLAHGTARFNDRFTAIKHETYDSCDPQEDGSVQCSQWLAESRKRVFLGQVGICTVDQVLISVLPVRHRFVRGFGVGRSVLIVDEVHAYDAYMYGLLEEVLRQQKECGGSAILLSATLPERQRQQLCAAWDTALDQQGEKTPYPLIIWTGGAAPQSYILDPSQKPEQRTVTVEPIRIDQMMPDEALLRRIIAAAEMRAQVAIVCNLVDVAQRLASILRKMTDLPVALFHARYCFSHRKEKELSAIQDFGLDGTRDTGRILVATQVVEQSLDVDFDWLITQLCPVDLLFQRMGRLHRHDRHGKRPPGFENPHCTVLLPEGNDFGLHGYIYANTRALWRTAEMLEAAPNGEIIFPDAYRTWIEAVYQEDSWKKEPYEIVASYDIFKSNIEDKRYKAQYMVDSAINPFNDNDENILAVTRDGEMSLIVIPFCRVSQGRMLMDGTIFETLDEYQRLEALSLNSVGVPASWRRCFEDPDEGRFWLELGLESDEYRGSSKGVVFRYHKDMGLEKEK